VGVLKFQQLGLLPLWERITSCADLRSQWNLKQSCSPCWELSNGVLYSTCTHQGRVDSWFLVVGSQTLTLSLSFHHNLCCRCPNGSSEPIFNIYTLIAFQWYKKMPRCKVFWCLQSNSRVSRVLVDSQVPTLGMRESSSHSSKIGLRHSRPLKVRNWPDLGVCKWSATHRWKALDESYKFTWDLITIEGSSKKLWAHKVAGVQTGTKNHLHVAPMESYKVYYMGEGGGFPRVWAVVSLVSPKSPMVCSSTKGAPESELTNLLVGWK
jgi:hypothetical protein